MQIDGGRDCGLVQVNALFDAVTFKLGGSCEYCSHKTVHGSFVKVLYVTARTEGENIVRVQYEADTPSRARLEVAAEGTKGAVERKANFCVHKCYLASIESTERVFKPAS